LADACPPAGGGAGRSAGGAFGFTFNRQEADRLKPRTPQNASAKPTTRNAGPASMSTTPSGPAAIATSARPEEVAKLQRRLGRRRAAHLAEEILARIASGLYARGIRRFVVSGGETSGAVLEALEVEALEVMMGRHRRRSFDDAGR
jgi:hypothetical protein